MSWLLDGTPATLEQLVDVRPGLRKDFDHIFAVLWSGDAVPVTVLELARLRVATLLACPAEQARRTPAAVAAGLDEDRIARLPRWPDDDAFGTVERACLAYTEQFVMDAKGITDDDVAAVRACLGEAGAVAFSVALALFEGTTRAALVLGASPPQTD